MNAVLCLAILFLPSWALAAESTAERKAIESVIAEWNEHRPAGLDRRIESDPLLSDWDEPFSEVGAQSCW